MEHLYDSEHVDSYHFHLIFPENDPYFIPYDSDELITRYRCDTCKHTKHFWHLTPCPLPGHVAGRFIMPGSCYHPEHGSCSKCNDAYKPELPPFPPDFYNLPDTDSDDSYSYSWYGLCYELTDSDGSSNSSYDFELDSD